MVLLNLRAPILSLIITIISVICELAFLSGSLTLMQFNVCRRLQKKQKVTVRSQHFRVLALTLFAMLAFVAIETVTSVFSDPQPLQDTKIQPCVRTVFGSTANDDPNRFESIHFKCVTLFGTNVSHSQGNFSIPTSEITCDKDLVYSYTIDRKVELPVEGAVLHCFASICAFVMLEGNTLYFSEPNNGTGPELKFLPSEINPNFVNRLDLEHVAETIALSYETFISEEGELRRRALLGSVEDTCPFSFDSGSGTTIPLGVIIGAAIVWAASLLLFFISLCLRKKIFFDITHPMHWARRVRHDIYRPIGAEPELEMDDVDGERRIMIIGYSPIKGD